MASRSLDDLLPGTKAKWLAVKAALPNLPIFEVCTYRSQEEQNILFEKRPRVTWTRYSKHTERRAIDFALKAPDPWDLKADINANDIPDFEEVGRMAEKCGLQWGIVDGRGVHKDFGHCQDNEIYKEA
jgi:hypothetical protein